jgi:hypothetical protein
VLFAPFRGYQRIYLPLRFAAPDFFAVAKDFKARAALVASAVVSKPR